MSLVSCWPIYENGTGDYLEESDKKNMYDAFTLANQEGVHHDETSIDDAEDELDTINDNQLKVVIPDLVNTLIFILFLIYYRVRSSYVTDRNLENNIDISNYAIEVTRFPKAGLTEEDFKKHFETYGTVREVAFAREYNDMLKLYTQRAQLSYQLGF